MEISIDEFRKNTMNVGGTGQRRTENAESQRGSGKRSAPKNSDATKRIHTHFSVALCASVCFATSALAQDELPDLGASSDASAPPPAAGAPARAEVVPPQVERRVDAVYPPAALAARQEASVVLLVTVEVDGTVNEARVAESGGPAFDAAALAAVAQWRFRPAERGGRAIGSRIRVPFQFSLPTARARQPTESPPQRETGPNEQQRRSPELAPQPAAAPSAAPTGQAPLEVTVRGKRQLRTQDRSISDFRVDREIITAAPRQDGAEVLRSAPGVYIGRAEGPAIAHNYMLRGFDAEHGQDLEFRVGGLPINMPSHIHGQGYADLGFLIGDVVRELRVTEGVNDPRQGDFAVAGSINLSLGVDQRDRGVRIRSGYGAFNTFRQLVLWAPRDAPEETFGAIQYMRTDGFGENRAGQLGSAILQYRFGTAETTYRAIGVLHTARSDLAGVVRQDDVDAGVVCFECVYPYPTAQAQNALASRVLLGLFADHEELEGANGQIGVWVGYDNFRLQKNFTGFIQSSQTLARVAGRGDLIEQQNRTLSLGLTGRYRTSPFRPASWAHGTIEVATDGRLDIIDQAQNLLDATVRNQTWDRRVDASIRGVDLGFWGDFDWSFTRYVSTRLGFRADVLSYDIEDRLGNFAPAIRPHDTYIVGFRRSALGLAFGPRGSIEVRPLRWLSVLGAYGEGYRSPQARVLDDGEDAPFSKVRSADLGLRFDWGSKLHLSVGGYYTHLSDDVAFDASEGRLERIGATQRLGAVVQATSHPSDWLVGSVSFTLVDATLLEPPPSTAHEPEPPFREGQNLPFVAPVVLRADLGAHRTFAEDFGGQALGSRAGLGFSFLSPRPLPFGELADPVGLLDASAAITWGPLDLSFEVFNALNAQYAAVEYNFPSDWNPDDGVRPRTPARHISAGAPLSWLLSLGVTL